MKRAELLILGSILGLVLGACHDDTFDGPDRRSSGDARGDGADGGGAGGEGLDGADGSDLLHPGGVDGGHFDLDTSISTYPFSQGKTEHHVHEYDDKFNSAGVDFFNILDDKFIDIKEGIPATTQRFILIVGNAKLSPGGVLRINGQSYGVQAWADKVSKKDVPIFVLGSPRTGETQLTEFKIAFDKTKSIDGQLVPTETKFVIPNDAGPNGEYRHGALTIQALDADRHTIDPTLGVAAIGSSGMFWEATLFWHYNKDSSP